MWGGGGRGRHADETSVCIPTLTRFPFSVAVTPHTLFAPRSIAHWHSRPCLVGLYWIDGLVIRDLLFTNSPFWTTHPTFCKNVEIVNLRVVTIGPNTGEQRQ